MHCGEYGEKNFRPHYHACIFGLDFSEDRLLFKEKAGYKLWESPALTEIWGQGFATVGDLTFRSAAYVARYVMKKVGGAPAEEHYSRVNTRTGELFVVRPEYLTMSLKPGLGAAWFEKFRGEVYPDDFCLLDGKKVKVPTFYDREMDKDSPDFMEHVRRARSRRADEHAEDSTPDRLFVREVCTDARLSHLPRSI